MNILIKELSPYDARIPGVSEWVTVEQLHSGLITISVTLGVEATKTMAISHEGSKSLLIALQKIHF